MDRATKGWDMTSPRLAIATEYGRLYRRPGDELPIGNVDEALVSGRLSPSVTNVIDVLNKPFLYGWHGRMAATAAVEIAKTFPHRLLEAPKEAVKWLSLAATRHTEKAADLGTRVHDWVERAARGEQQDEPDADLRGYIASWRKFCADYNPTFTHLEATTYGTVDGLGYAGTADFIAEINGLTVIGDWKSGRSIHTSAALQLAALAHADTLVDDDDLERPMPRIDAGIVVHLTPTGYKVRQTELHGLSWQTFRRLRAVWNFHVTDLASRDPLLMTDPLPGPAALFADRDPAKA